MVSEQPTRRIVREFKEAGWISVSTDGSHTKYRCPCGGHTFSLPDGHRMISPGVVRKARTAINTCGGSQ